MDIDNSILDDIKSIIELINFQSFHALSIINNLFLETASKTTEIDNATTVPNNILFISEAVRKSYLKSKTDIEIDSNLGGLPDLTFQLKYGQGTISKRERKNKNGTIKTYYQAKYYFNGTQISVYGKTKQECLDKLKNIRDNAKKGELEKPDKSTLTLGVWLIDWYKLYKETNVGEAHQLSLMSQINTHLLLNLGDIKLKDLTTAKLQSYFITVPESNTRNKLIITITDALNSAVENKKIKENPAKNLKIKKHKAENKRAFVFSEQNDILKNALPKYKALFYFLCCTGLRIGEFLALTKEDIDVDNNVIRLNKAMNVNTGHIKKFTKNGEIHHIPFLNELLATVYDILDNDDFIGTYTYSGANQYFKKLFKKLKIVGTTIHSTRHTFSSVCYYAKIPDKYMQKWMNHKTLAITMDTYTELLGVGSSPVLEYIYHLKERYVV